MKFNTLEKLYQCLQDESPGAFGQRNRRRNFASIQRILALKLKHHAKFRNRYTIVGTGLAGLSLTKYLSEQNPNLQITLLSKTSD